MVTGNPVDRVDILQVASASVGLEKLDLALKNCFLNRNGPIIPEEELENASPGVHYCHPRKQRSNRPKMSLWVVSV